jgi:hypothetical protein
MDSLSFLVSGDCFTKIRQAREGREPRDNERKVGLNEAVEIADDAKVDKGTSKLYAETRALKTLHEMEAEPSEALYRALRDKNRAERQNKEALERLDRIKEIIDAEGVSRYGLKYDIARALGLDDPTPYADVELPW